MPRFPDMPSVVKVYLPGGDTIQYEEMPCSIVPAEYGAGRPATTDELQWDTWIDFPGIYQLFDGAGRNINDDFLRWQGASSTSPSIVHYYHSPSGFLYVYQVVLVMFRWTDTDDEHQRAYLSRLSRTLPV
jgi:hypothetical protein